MLKRLKRLNEQIEVPPEVQRFIGHMTAGFGCLFLFFAGGLLFSGGSISLDTGAEDLLKVAIAVSIPGVIGVLLVIAGLKILREIEDPKSKDGK